MSQVQEIQIILHDLLAEGMEVNEPFQVASIIEKLPPQWKDFKKYLKHKRKELKLEDLILRLQIEEDNRNIEAKSYKKVIETEAKANLAESNNKRNRRYDGKKKGKAKKFQGNYYNYGKPNDMTNLVDDPREWWIDTGSTSHICAARDIFSTYTIFGDRKLFMGNFATSKVIGVGNVVLKMTSGKGTTLKNVLHMQTFVRT
ncbi:uncharacterized protein [Henckelia pumila]|uniref:uncharacterized protein n=1 Tax=Henckelia pumila TaxID=405737 RepID=UPI003C6E6B86